MASRDAVSQTQEALQASSTSDRVVGDKAREAVASLRGYAYQVYAAALTWLELGGEEELYLEVAEDFARVAHGSLSGVQVKDTPGSISLASETAREAVSSFVQLVESNPSRAVRLVFLTTAIAVQEKKRDHRTGTTPALEYWKKVGEGHDIAPLRKVLEVLDFDEKTREFIRSRSDEQLRTDLIQRIEWRYGERPIDALAHSLRERVASYAFNQLDVPIAEGRRFADNVFVRVLEASVAPERTKRVLRSGQLRELLDTASRVSVPRAIAEVMLQSYRPERSEGDLAPAVGVNVGSLVDLLVEGLAARLTPPLASSLRQSIDVRPPTEATADQAAEDPALHAQIDLLREMWLGEDQPLIVEKRLVTLLDGLRPDEKPWARFRILTNLGAIALRLGREQDAIPRFTAAHAVRPTDPKAISNLALVRMLEGRHEEAMALARAALNGTPRADHAVEYLLHAAARSTWVGPPETLVPADLVGKPDADFGLADFHWRRRTPGWQKICMDLAARHPAVPEFRPLNAAAVLSLVIDKVDAGVVMERISSQDLNTAADDMKALVERLFRIGFSDAHDLRAHLNNASILLRLCGRHQELEELLRRFENVVTEEPALRRLMALTLVELGRRKEAIAWIELEANSESRLVLAELRAVDDPAAALEIALAIDPGSLDPNLCSTRLHIIADLAARLRRIDVLEGAIKSIREIESAGWLADLLELKGVRRRRQ